MAEQRGSTFFEDSFKPPPERQYRGLSSINEEEEILLQEHYGNRFEHDPEFKGPLKERSCTDIFCFLVFVCFLVIWVLIGVYAFSNGDPKRLFSATDSEGNDCGKDKEVKDKPYLFFFDLGKCASPKTIRFGCATPQVCVEKCPNETFVGPVRMKTNFLEARKLLICKYNFNKQMVLTPADMEQSWKENNCAKWYLTSRSFSMRCIPKPNINVSEEEDFEYIDVTQEKIDEATMIVRLLFEAKEMGEIVVHDIKKFWPWLMFGMLLTTAFSLAYIIVIRWLASILVWFTVVILILTLLTCIVVSSIKLKEMGEENPKSEEKEEEERRMRAINHLVRVSESNSTLSAIVRKYLPIHTLFVVFLVLSIIALIVVLLLVFSLHKHMQLALAMIKEASKAITISKLTLAFPVIPLCMQLLCIGWTVTMILFLASARVPTYKVVGLDNDTTCSCESYKEGSICTQEEFDKQCHDTSDMSCNEATCQFFKYEILNLVPVMHGFNILSFLWSLALISCFGELVITSVFSTWFWAVDKSKLPFFMLGSSIWWTVRYHIGTLTLASFVLCLCRCIRIYIEFLHTRLKGGDNVVSRCMYKCLFCLFFCLEKFIKYMNSNALVTVAIHGKSFCTAAVMAFNLLMRNITRVFAVTQVTSFIMVLGNLMVMCLITAISLIIFMYHKEDEDDEEQHTSWHMGPLILTVVCSYFISSSFFGLYSMAVNTLFMCFLEDIERNDGSLQQPYYMSRNLIYILGKEKEETEA